MRIRIRLIMLAIVLFMSVVVPFADRMGRLIGRELNRILLVHAPPGVPTPFVHDPVPTRTPTPTAIPRKILKPLDAAVETATPEPDDGSPLSPRQYMVKMDELLQEMGTTTEMIDELLGQLGDDERVLYDPTWVDDINYYLDQFLSVNARMGQLNAPSDFREFHDGLADYIAHCNTGTRLFQQGINQLDTSLIERSQKELELGFAALEQAFSKFPQE